MFTDDAIGTLQTGPVMNEALAEILNAYSGDGLTHKRRSTAFGLLLFSVLAIVAGIFSSFVSASGIAQHVFTLIAALALLSSVYLTAGLKGGPRVVFLAGAAGTVAILSAGLANRMAGGGYDPGLESAAGGALLFTLASLFVSAIRTKSVIAGAEQRTASAK